MSLTGKWSISQDEENYHGQFDTLEEAITEGIQYGTFFVGQCVAPTPPEELFDGEVILHWLEYQVREHDDYAGEWADGAVDASREQRSELADEMRPLIAAWLDRHALRPTHWNIDPQSVRYFDAEVGYSIMS